MTWKWKPAVGVRLGIFGAVSVILVGSPGSSTGLPTESELAGIFEQAGITGSLVLFDLEQDEYRIHNPNRAEQGFLPASTFKIFNALVALETGVVPDEQAVIRWDGVPRQIKEWNRDLSLEDAFRVSAVWYFQELARRIGIARMQSFVDRVDYGNRDLSGAAVDTFWLEGNLRITQRQQVEFLVRLWKGDLPFASRTIELVKQIMIQEAGPDCFLRAKTGWTARVEPQIGWYVGWVESPGRHVFFAANIDIRKSEDAAARIVLSRQALVAAGFKCQK